MVAGPAGRAAEGMSLGGHLAQLRARGIRPGLVPLRAALARLGNPEQNLRAITVAGTNGKGSVAFYADALLRALGYRTARYISPPLLRFPERLAVDGAEVPLAVWEEEHARAQAELGENHELTEFEYTTLLAFLLMRRHKVAAAVLEVGLGGRLDAVNVVDAEVAVITSVGLDHQEYLGGTLALIAAEKAGIMRARTPAVVGDLPEAALAVVAARAGEQSSPLYRYGAQFRDWPDLGLTEPALRNRAPVQRVDALLAAKAVQIFHDGPLAPAAVRAALERAVLPGRGELIAHDGKRYYFDTAHNPEAAGALAAALREIAGEKSLLCGMMRDKHAEGFLRELVDAVLAVATVTLPGARAATAAELAAAAQEEGLPGHALAGDLPAVFAAWDRALPPATLRVIAGSHALVGPLRELVTGGNHG